MKKIHYKGGYKYQLVQPYVIQVSVTPLVNIKTPYVDLTKEGKLTIKKGYAWDGPSGPTVDTKDFMRGALVHDALYQLMRNSFISRQKWRKTADQELRRLCLEDGMPKIRAQYVYWAVRRFAGKAASQKLKKKIETAP